MQNPGDGERQICRGWKKVEDLGRKRESERVRGDREKSWAEDKDSACELSGRGRKEGFK